MQPCKPLEYPELKRAVWSRARSIQLGLEQLFPCLVDRLKRCCNGSVGACVSMPLKQRLALEDTSAPTVVLIGGEDSAPS